MTITAEGRTRSDPYLQDANTTAHVVAAFALQTPFRTVNAAMIPILAYMADRRHCASHGHPILHAERASTREGPINVAVAVLAGRSETPALHPDMRAAWSSMLETRGGLVRVREGIGEDDLDELSVASRESIDATWREFGALTDIAFMAWSRAKAGHADDPLPEWDPADLGPIGLEAMLIGTGMDATMAAECARQESDMRGVSLVLHGY